MYNNRLVDVETIVITATMRLAPTTSRRTRDSQQDKRTRSSSDASRAKHCRTVSHLQVLTVVYVSSPK